MSMRCFELISLKSNIMIESIESCDRRCVIILELGLNFCMLGFIQFEEDINEVWIQSEFKFKR